MSYDSAPASALAQGYFVQALALAQAGSDRMLGASILDAMSHQATFAGWYTEAATSWCRHVPLLVLVRLLPWPWPGMVAVEGGG